MTSSIAKLEADRRALQAQLDAQKTQAERNKLGQFATPPTLAEDILRYAMTLFPADAKIRFLDPAIGTGAFYAALRATVPKTRVPEAIGFEVDPHYGNPAAALWRGTGLEYRLGDFTDAAAVPRSNVLICNPPYVRHHHLSNVDKVRLQQKTQMASGLKLSGLSGLYCHFIGLSHAWMANDGVAGWLIPSEFMDVNYGQALKRYLLDKVTLLHIHRFDPNDVQFTDALVSSAIVWFRKALPPENHVVRFTFGGTLAEPKLSRSVAAKALAHEMKWTRFPVADVRQKSGIPTIADFFRIKRGLATGDNGYFILSLDQIRARNLPMEAFRSILPSPRYVPDDKIEADAQGRPQLERQLFLLDTSLTEPEVEQRYPTLFTYLQEGKQRSLHDRYLCRHRALWYAQENRPPAPIVCTYLGRGNTARKRPFRFILNRSNATAANVYLMMYPTPLLAGALRRDPTLIHRVWDALNSITAAELLGEGRVYGGGLHKLEPKELANVPVPQLMELLPGAERPAKQADLLAEIAA
jgi:predicted RNA methylase